MARHPLALLAFLSLAACADERATPLALDRSSGLAVTGSPVVIHATVEEGCADRVAPTARLTSGEPLPAWLTATAQARSRSGATYVANPGSGMPFDIGTVASAPAPDLPPQLVASYLFTLVAAPGAPVNAVEVWFLTSGCGRSGQAVYRLQVVGDSGRAGMCGWSSGGACGADDGCRRVGFYGLLCAEAGAAAPTDEPWTLACADPVVTGATCGCVAGACAWH